jgi:hypothetical protein
MKKVYVLLFGFECEGYSGLVRVFSSRELAKAEAEKEMIEGDYDYYLIDEVEVENN